MSRSKVKAELDRCKVLLPRLIVPLPLVRVRDPVPWLRTVRFWLLAPWRVTAPVLPKVVVGLRTEALPEVAPRVMVVASPKALTVVAVVLKTLKEVEPVTTLVVKLGEVLKTATPVPVSSLSELSKAAEVAVVLSCDEPSVKTALLAVRPLKVIVPEEDRPVRLPKVPVMVELPVTAIPPEVTVKVLTLGLVARTILPVPVVVLPSKVKVPVVSGKV